MDNKMPLSRTIVENRAKIVLVRLLYLNKCILVSLYLLNVSYYKLFRCKNITPLSYFSAEARTRNIPETQYQEIEFNVAVKVTDSNKYNINGN